MKEGLVKIHWQWVVLGNYHRLGYSEDDLGCILVRKYLNDGSIEETLLSHDCEFDDFFAWYGVNMINLEGWINFAKIP